MTAWKKIVLSIACLAAPSVFSTLIRMEGLILGVIPTLILYGISLYALNVIWKAKEPSDNPSETPNNQAERGVEGGDVRIEPSQKNEGLYSPSPIQPSACVDAPPRNEEQPIHRNSSSRVAGIVAICILSSSLLVSVAFLLAQKSEIEQMRYDYEDQKLSSYLDGYNRGYEIAAQEHGEASEDRGSSLMNSERDAYIYAAANYYLRNAVIASGNGQFYHKFGCPDAEFEKYFIYNTDLAASYDYEPCPVCYSEPVNRSGAILESIGYITYTPKLDDYWMLASGVYAYELMKDGSTGGTSDKQEGFDIKEYAQQKEDERKASSDKQEGFSIREYAQQKEDERKASFGN